MSNAPKLRTRRPTGKPPWPVLLIAGVEKTGKSYGAALFSASDLIDRTIIVELGEGAADQYGAIDGARYEIAIHDGTYASILEQIEGAVAEPRTNGKPHAIVIDNVTELWDMLSDEAQLKANQRARAKAAEQRKAAPVGEAQITMDLWNVAKKKWRRVIDALRVHDGPVILLARLESVAVMDGNAPAKSGAREWKVRAEKNLPFECDAIVKMTAPQECFLTGVRSVVLQVPPGEHLPLPQFTIDGLLRKMGLDAAGATAPRSYTAPQPVLDADEAPEERSAQRERDRSDDEWSTAGPALPTPQQINELTTGLRFVRGAESHEAQRAALSQILRREVVAGEQLPLADVERAVAVLHEEDRQNHAPRPAAAEQPPATPVAPAPVADRQAVDHILGGMRAVRGIRDDAALKSAIEAEVQHRVDDPYTLTVDEVAGIRGRLEAERRAKQAGPAVGTPDNPAATDADQKMMQGLLNKAGFNGPRALDLVGRVLRRPVTTLEGMSRADARAVIAAVDRVMETGEVPPPLPGQEGPAPSDEGIAEFDVLLQMIDDVRPDDEAAFGETQRAIEDEFRRGRISQVQVETLRARLADQVTAVPA